MADNLSREGRHARAQVWAAMAALAVGCGCVVAGLLIPPMGEIHPSVLVAFGEALTFAGAVLGVKYHYDYRRYINKLAKK